MTKAKAILFDLDGVLINSIDAWYLAFKETLKHVGLRMIDKREFKENYWGQEIEENLRRLQMDDDAEKYCLERYFSHIDKIRLFEGTKEVLERARRFKVGLVTNTPKSGVSKILKQFGLEKYFDAVVTRDEVERGKPNPEIVIKACNFLGVKPKEAMVVGDTRSDVRAGRGAGSRVIGLGVNADKRIEKLSDLLELI